ncbi:hypothetical protein GCM10007103_06840 [Salinimicrobium marinum]|uniref:Attractin/MKLN-like beta-propeller domain-containing protein n=1 Tax=Salinimicrobium marinum TaxID=680283 RepID=A0A918VVW6_9FLAO|nr:galactose oxidase [Salinimicrobium marinum]GHA27987.1 hypothetical protein GCM10007103_06840 [Salinimicrobium marinum]
MKNLLCLFLLLFSTIAVHSQTPSWKSLAAKGEVHERHENAMTLVGNNMILIGGRGNKPLDILNTETMEWSQGAQPPFEIHHFQAAALDGLLYVLGAFTGGWPYETPLSHVLIYDVSEDLWITGPKIPENRRRGAAGVTVYQNKIYLVNGIINGHTSGWVNWLDEYDPYSNTWKILPNAPVARDHFQPVVIGDQLFVAGGRQSGSVTDNGFAGTVTETNVYDFKSGKWEVLSNIPTPRAGSATVVYNGNPTVLGGESDAQEAAHAEVEMLEISSGTWKKLPDMKKGRHGTQAVAVNNVIIIGAGSGNRGGGPELTSFEIFAPEENSEITAESLQKGELIVFPDQLNFSERKQQSFTIKNSSSNKAMLISYIETDDSEKIKLTSDFKSPLIIPPGETIELKMEIDEDLPKDFSGILFIKPAGKSAPLQIPLKVN